jgi:hypothetical protein
VVKLWVASPCLELAAPVSWEERVEAQRGAGEHRLLPLCPAVGTCAYHMLAFTGPQRFLLEARPVRTEFETTFDLAWRRRTITYRYAAMPAIPDTLHPLSLPAPLRCAPDLSESRPCGRLPPGLDRCEQSARQSSRSYEATLGVAVRVILIDSTATNEDGDVCNYLSRPS